MKVVALICLPMNGVRPAKTWLAVDKFAVADIGDIKWSLSPFDCSTIPDEDKEIIVALTESRTARVPDNVR
jgi:hypothetical protein